MEHAVLDLGSSKGGSGFAKSSAQSWSKTIVLLPKTSTALDSITAA